MSQNTPTPRYDANWTTDALDLDNLDYGMQTLAVRAGQHRSDEGEHSEALYMTSSFVYADAADAAAHFAGEVKGNIYARFTNPSVRTFERRLAALEGGERCVATSSGMAAILTLCMAYLKAGDHLLAAKQLFGSSMSLFNNYLVKFGVTVTYVDVTNHAAWQAAIRDNTKLLYVESPSNPLAQIADIAFLSQLAHAHGALLAVDNCFATPALQQPLKFGADIVVHSATKYIDGQGRALGGALIGNADLLQEAHLFVRTAGPSMSPFHAWLFTKGLETLKLRMLAHSDNAMQVAQFLSNHPKVLTVHHAGLPDHPAYKLCKKQQLAPAAIVGFEVVNGRTGAWQVIDNTHMLSITGNLGDAKTTITHPATTTHARLTPEARADAGVTEGLIRLSVGLEDAKDIIADLARGLDTL